MATSADAKLPPFVGPERAEWLHGLCGHAPKGSDILAECLADAKWHGIVMNPDRTAVLASLSSCDEHKSLMALSATLVHEMSDACGMPEAEIWWDGDRSGCRVAWNPSAGELSIAQLLPAETRA